jgi:4-amino-4-deoxy-L-arabinose transferase-like glycosyltransferase
MIPLGEGVDETPHFDYIRYVKEHRGLPVQPLTREEGVQVLMGHHPPLYYVLGGLGISWIDTSDFGQVFRYNPHFVWGENLDHNGWNVMMHFGQDRFPWKGSVLAMHVARLMTIGFGTVALYAIYNATKIVFPTHIWAPLGATALIGFNPSFVFMSSTVHHDTLQTAIFALTILWALKFLKGPDRKSDIWLGGILLGAALLVKLSGLALGPLLGLVLLLKHRQSWNWQKLIAQALSVFAIAALVAGWWFIRNQWLYGDPLGWRMFLHIHRHMIRPDPHAWQGYLVHDFLAQILRTFWGAFGYMHITFPNITKYLWWTTVLAGVGLINGLLRGNLIPRARWPEWGILLAALFLLFASFVRFAVTTVGAGHGRYLFPAGASIGSLLIAGLNGFTAWRHHRLISIALAVGMIAYAIWLPIKHVLPKYASTETATAAQLTKAEPVKAVLADSIELVAYQSDTKVVQPGQWIHMDLYWRAIGLPHERLDPHIRLQATDQQGNVLDSDTRWPVPSLSPNVWPPETVYVSHMPLGMPAEGLAGQVQLQVGALVKNGQEILPAQGTLDHPEQDGMVTIEHLLAVGAITQVSPDDVPNRRQEVFDSTLALDGFELPTAPISPGSVIPVSLYWHVLKRPTANYTVFVHVLNDRGELVTQFDQPPGGGSVPTSTWQEGQTLHDAYPLPIPSSLSAGIYTIHIGMYTQPSLQRLPVYINDQVIGDSVVLSSIEIGR